MYFVYVCKNLIVIVDVPTVYRCSIPRGIIDCLSAINK